MQMSTVLAIPICAGTVSRLSDATVAFCRRFASICDGYVISMLSRGAGAIYLAARTHRQFFFGILTIYPVDTAWLTGPGTSGETSQLDWAAAAILVPLGVGVSISATGDREWLTLRRCTMAFPQ